jgi:tripartite-type tricarboxylate transporter receptor subunit TctC
MRQCKISSIVLVLAIFMLSPGGILSAADYPQKPVQILVGFPPGGPADLGARALAEASKPFFPQPFIVVNKPGGGSVLATAEVVRAAPDGYTIGIPVISALTASPFLEPNLPYKGPDDIQPIISCIHSPTIFATKADAPWKNMNEFIAHAKANPGTLRIGNPGVGTTAHLYYLSLKYLGVPMSEVPFSGAATAVTALLGGHVEGVVLNVTGVLPHVKGGKLKFLSLFSDVRINNIPELAGVPTLKELGYKVLTEGATFFMAAPKRTPQHIIDMLYDTFLKAEKTDFFQKFARDNVLEVPLKGALELEKEMNRTYTLFGDFIKKAGLAKQK